MASRFQQRSGEVADFAADNVTRRTGIPPAGDVPWGSHLCIFYHTKQDLLELAVPYFEAGVKSSEFCLWAISDPITLEDAESVLRDSIPDLDERLGVGQIELLLGPAWYFQGGEFDLQRAMRGWHEKLSKALEEGFQGMRVSANAFWVGTSYWKQFLRFEQQIGPSIADENMICLCTYGLQVSKPVDLLDVADLHQHTIVRRNHEWTSLKAPDDKLDVLQQSITGVASLTPREGLVLAKIVQGLSSKEVAQLLRISRRTVEYHRANLLKKLALRTQLIWFAECWANSQSAYGLSAGLLCISNTRLVNLLTRPTRT